VAEGSGDADGVGLDPDLDLVDAEVVAAGWRRGLRDFELRLADSRFVVFEDCLQASLLQPPGPPGTLTVTAGWSDEPSPYLLSLEPAVRFQYRHYVFELGEAMLRVACRRVRVEEAR
jgi:hypothetical protein